jgi:hypothetical protein
VALHAKPAVQRSVWWLMNVHTNVHTNVNVREDGPKDGLSEGCLHEDVLELLPGDQLRDPIIPLINRCCWQMLLAGCRRVGECGEWGQCGEWGEWGGRVDGWEGVAALAAPSSIGEARRGEQAGRGSDSSWGRQAGEARTKCAAGPK